MPVIIYMSSCVCKEMIFLNIVDDQSNSRNCGHNSKERKNYNVEPMP